MKIVLDMKCRVIICDDNVETSTVDRQFANLEELHKYVCEWFVPWTDNYCWIRLSDKEKIDLGNKIFQAMMIVYNRHKYVMCYPPQFDSRLCGCHFTVSPCFLYIKDKVTVDELVEIIERISE